MVKYVKCMHGFLLALLADFYMFSCVVKCFGYYYALIDLAFAVRCY